LVAAQRHWRVLSTHAHILMILHLQPRIIMREVAAAVGITERRVAANIADLQAEGLVKVIKRGPRNTYRVRRSASLVSIGAGAEDGWRVSGKIAADHHRRLKLPDILSGLTRSA